MNFKKLIYIKLLKLSNTVYLNNADILSGVSLSSLIYI